MSHFYDKMKSPVGKLTLVANNSALVAVLWENDDPKRVRIERGELNPNHHILKKAKLQLKEYFSGKRKTFDVPVRFEGTDFQKKVWRELCKIPFGQAHSYAKLAQQIGSPKACRAVGSANRRNPISIIVPCHRVIAGSGKLAGFAGGLTAKEHLLRLEGFLNRASLKLVLSKD